MKHPLFFIIMTLLTGCVENSVVLRLEEQFTMGESNYLLSISTTPKELSAEESFNMKIELKDLESSRHPMHITYEVKILDKDGENVFVDSLHTMEGAPYTKDIVLGAGDYTLKLVLIRGMGEETMKLHETQLRFKINE